MFFKYSHWEHSDCTCPLNVEQEGQRGSSLSPWSAWRKTVLSVETGKQSSGMLSEDSAQAQSRVTIGEKNEVYFWIRLLHAVELQGEGWNQTLLSTQGRARGRSPKDIQSCLHQAWHSPVGSNERRPEHNLAYYLSVLQQEKHPGLYILSINQTAPCPPALPKSKWRRFVSLHTYGSCCITAPVSSPLKCNIAACHTWRWMTCLTPWFKQRSGCK